MKREFNKIVENFVGNIIERKAEYLLLTNRSNDVTIFKTNLETVKTIKNVMDLLNSLGDKDIHTRLRKDIEEINDNGDFLTFIVEIHKEKERFYLFDYTGAVIESV